MLFDIPTLELEFSAALKVPIKLAVATGLALEDSLSACELQHLRRIDSQARRKNWLLGRNALKVVLAGGGDRCVDTTALLFPNPNLSLSHKSNLAIAVYTGNPKANGIGIDYETSTRFRPDLAQFFLAQAETKYLNQYDCKCSKSLMRRIWSIKEAVFKADLQNENFDLCDYVLAEPRSMSGIASNVRTDRRFRYCSIEFESSVLSVAVPAEIMHLTNTALPKCDRSLARAEACLSWAPS